MALHTCAAEWSTEEVCAPRNPKAAFLEPCVDLKYLSCEKVQTHSPLCIGCDPHDDKTWQTTRRNCKSVC